MRSQSLLRLPATRWDGLFVTGAPRALSQPHMRHHRHASSGRKCTPSSNLLRPSPPRSTIRACRIPQTTSLRNSSTSSGSDGVQLPAPAARRSRKPVLIHFALIVSVLAGTIYYTNEKRKARFTLNDERFMPCPVLSSEPVSPTAFILTIQTPLTALVQTQGTVTNHAVVERARRHGLWSVEVKQPQLQIARSYTPLPPAPGDDPELLPEQERRRLRSGLVPLRLYVRRYDGGEVSTYLAGLKRGDLVEIRGPHLGFDLGARLGGAGREVVFLAGGTGIAPAMQAAAYLKDQGDVDVRILWANRSTADCAGCPRLADASRSFFLWIRPKAGDAHLEETPSAITRQLEDLQIAYAVRGHKLDVQCVVDEEGSKFGARDIASALSASERTKLATDASSTCYLHSQQRLEYSAEAGDAAGKAGVEEVSRGLERRRCNCAGEGGIGKNLFMISGPDGFVSAYVGPKVWADGAERQGRVGGVVAELTRKDPETWKNWLVLKQ